MGLCGNGICLYIREGPEREMHSSFHKAAIKMFKISVVAIWVLVFLDVYVKGCLITNCPRGGKRNGRMPLFESSIKQVSLIASPLI